MNATGRPAESGAPPRCHLLFGQRISSPSQLQRAYSGTGSGDTYFLVFGEDKMTDVEAVSVYLVTSLLLVRFPSSHFLSPNLGSVYRLQPSSITY